MNSIQTYIDCGRRAAVAMNQKDMSRYNHEKQWLRGALALEPEGPVRLACVQAYEESFREHRNIPRVDYFR